jgi:hypothetical protein
VWVSLPCLTVSHLHTRLATLYVRSGMETETQMVRLLNVVAMLVMVGCLVACGDSESEVDDVTKACNVITQDCGAAAKGFTFDECRDKMKDNSVGCLQCILGLTDPCTLNGTNPNYVSICHSGSGCDLK